MKIVEQFRDRLIGAWVGAGIGREAMVASITAHEEAQIREQESRESALDATIKEGLADLELSLEDVNWRDISGGSGLWNFSRDSLRKMIALSRVMYLVNPLIKRAVTVQELYVWGSGCTVRSENDDVNGVLKDFFEDPANQAIIGAAFPEREREQRIDGNTFFVLFRNKVKGRARIRLLPVDEVQEIIRNPDDAKEPWFYRRMGITASSQAGDLTFNQGQEDPIESCLYPDLDYNPNTKPSFYNGLPIRWESPVVHVKTGGLTSMAFGMPELYSVLNWATAYKKILENFATILSAYARLAMRISGLGGPNKIAAAKSRMQTGVNLANGGRDTNPASNAASWFMASGNVDVSPVKTANSTTGPDEARALRSMVAAGSDTPEHFFGDSDIGNFATSSTLDRPTELKMISRQTMWANVIIKLSGAIIKWSAQAPGGKLRAAGFAVSIDRDPFNKSITVTVTPPAGAESPKVLVAFPSILERDVVDRVRAVVQAATLGGSKAEGIIPDRKLLFKWLVTALGEKNAEELADKIYPKDVIQGFVDPAQELQLKKDQLEVTKLVAKNRTAPAAPAAAAQ